MLPYKSQSTIDPLGYHKWFNIGLIQIYKLQMVTSDVFEEDLLSGPRGHHACLPGFILVVTCERDGLQCEHS